MSLADRIAPFASRILPRGRIDGSRNLVRDAWNLLSGLPGGKIVFSKLIGRLAPYTGTINAIVTVLRPGYAEVVMQDWSKIRTSYRKKQSKNFNISHC